MFSATESDALHSRARAFIRGSLRGEPTEPFDALALDIARFQAAHVPAIARLALLINHRNLLAGHAARA